VLKPAFLSEYIPSTVLVRVTRRKDRFHPEAGTIYVTGEIASTLWPDVSPNTRRSRAKKLHGTPVEFAPGVVDSLENPVFPLDLQTYTPGVPIVPLDKLLMDGQHPLCTIGEEFQDMGPDGVVSYLRHKISKMMAIDEGLSETTLAEDTTVDGSHYLRGTRIYRRATCPPPPAPVVVEVMKLGVPYISVMEDYLSDAPEVFVRADITQPCTLSMADYLQHTSNWSKRNGWCIDPPTGAEMTPNAGILAALREHLKGLDLEITGLQCRNLAYYSDGNDMNGEAIPDEITPSFYSGHRNFYGKNQKPLLYLGEAWCLVFKSPVAEFAGVHMYFATEDQYLKSCDATLPLAAEKYRQAPWGDGFIFICSDWCQRNGSKNYSRGIDLSNPHRRCCSIREWIVQDYAQVCLRNGHAHPWGGEELISTGGFDPYAYAMKLASICGTATGVDFSSLETSSSEDSTDEEEDEEPQEDEDYAEDDESVETSE